MTDPAWDVQEVGIWYDITARATCPRCGQAFEERSQRRRAAGRPDTPPLELRVVDATGVELVAPGMFLPIATHRCPG